MQTYNTYNGWKGAAGVNTGAATWTVSLHLSNDEQTAVEVDELVKTTVANYTPSEYDKTADDRRRGLIWELAARIRDYAETRIEFYFENANERTRYENDAAGGLIRDLVNFAISAVEFHDLAETYIEDYAADGGVLPL